MDVKIKIYFILPSLNGGGAERVILTLLKNIDNSLFSPTLVLLSHEGNYQVPENIPVINLHVLQARYALFKIIRLIQRDQPDIVFSTLGYLNLLIAIIRPLLSKKTSFISRESNTVSMENKQEKYPRMFDFLYRHVYNNFDHIITQSNYMKHDLIDNYNTDGSKIKMIYNPVDFDTINNNIDKKQNSISASKQKINLIAAGRLSWQKGFDLLLHTMTYLDDHFHLYIVGEGEDLAFLQKLQHSLGLKKRVTFLGFVVNPHALMAASDLLVLSSRYEGLPNVVLEAAACGLPTVAFNTPGGTREIVIDGFNGFLVDEITPKALSQSIKQAARHDFDQEKIKAYCKENFSTDQIITQYSNFFLETTS